MQDKLAADFVRIEQRVKDLRSQAGRLKTKKDNPIVGAAITQANAHLRQKDFAEALATIVAAEKQCRDHPDLLVMHARCLLKMVPPKPDEARRLTRKAFGLGSRKEILFEVWYEAEWAAEHYNGAVEATEYVIANSANPKSDWLIRRAAAQWCIAKDQEKAGNLDRAIKDYRACAQDLLQARHSASPDEGKELRRQFFLVHDSIWSVLSESSDRSVDTATKAIDELRKMIDSGDFRIPVYLRLIEALGWLVRDSLSRKTLSAGLKNMMDQRIREVREEIDRYSRQHPQDARVSHLITQWETAHKSIFALDLSNE